MAYNLLRNFVNGTAKERAAILQLVALATKGKARANSRGKRNRAKSPRRSSRKGSRARKPKVVKDATTT